MRWLGGMIAGLVLGLSFATGGSAVGAETWEAKAVLQDAPVGDAKPQMADGTVAWTTGADASGAATLIGTATFPARGLELKLTIAANPDKSIPASHLLDLQFEAGAEFAGKSIADVSAVALKNEDGATGVKLIGAVARVTDNSFLVALSNAAADLSRNMALLGDRDFMDIGIVDAAGQRFVVTLALGGARAAFADFAAAGLK